MSQEKNRIQIYFTITIGILYILLALLINEWTLISLFSADGEISQTYRLLIRIADLLLIGLGISTICLRSHSIMININLLVISCIFSWTVAEVYLNYTYIYTALMMAADEEIGDSVEDLRIPDEYLHHIFKRNVTVILSWGNNDRVIYHTNSIGYRDREKRDILTKSQASRRILVLGDSFTEAVGMEYEESFFGHLDRLFRANDHDVEVLNGGMSSYSPMLEYRALEKFLQAGYTTNEVVLMYDISDINDEFIYATIDWKSSMARWIEANKNMWQEDHWNQRGHAFVGKLLFDHLSSTDER